MNKKTTTVLRNVVRELFEDGMALDPSRFEGLNPPIDPAAYDQDQLQMPGSMWDPQYQDAGTPGLPSMSPVYSDPQGLAMSPDHREPQYTTPEDIAQSRNAMYAGIAAHNNHNSRYDTAMGHLDPTFASDMQRQRDEEQRYVDARNAEIEHRIFLNDVRDNLHANVAERNPQNAREIGQGYDPALGNLNHPGSTLVNNPAVGYESPVLDMDNLAYPNHNELVIRHGSPMDEKQLRHMNLMNAKQDAQEFNNSINAAANNVRQAGRDINFNNSINNVANTARQAGQDINFSNSANSAADTARQAGSQIALNNATNTIRDSIDRVANRFQRDAMQNQIEAHNRTQPNGVDPAVGTYANIRAHNPRTGYDPALGPVINAANSVKDAADAVQTQQPWYQQGLNWMKNNKIATAGMIGVPAALAGAYMLNKRRNRNQQNG